MSDEFPKRPDAHVSEDVSIGVFRESLPPRWIFRDQSSRNDYGIDAEVELVTVEGELRGDVAKVQLKGQAEVAFNSDGVAAVGGIKQSTLRYWLGLSKYANVIVCITDNKARQAYFTPVFWEATERLDGSEETRSIHFRRSWSLKATDGPALFAFATVHRPQEVIRTHAAMLKALASLLHDFLWVFQADMWMVHKNDGIIRDWLTNGQKILGILSKEDQRLFDFEYWRGESEKQWNDSPMFGTLRTTYAKTFPLVFARLHAISAKVKAGRYFWSETDPAYLELVEATELPDKYDRDSILKFVQEKRIEEPG